MGDTNEDKERLVPLHEALSWDSAVEGGANEFDRYFAE